VKLNPMPKTYVINLIAGPSSGKSTLAAIIFAQLKLKKYNAEYVQEFAKHLVWTENYDTLNNQYYVTKTQYEILNKMNNKVEFIVTDGPLVHGLYYNRHNKENISNIEKTEQFILDCNNKFNNINIFINRGNIEYETAGRLQTEEEAKEIDVIIRHLLRQNSIPYTEFQSSADPSNIDKIITYILERCTE
jgi:nicotinamide riboside kinase